MKRLEHLFARLGLGLLLVLAWPSPANACSACFGASDSKMAEGMNMGIFSLLVVVGLVLAALGGFFIFLAKRASLTPMPGAPMATTQHSK